jgi:hypothetical protein
MNDVALAGTVLTSPTAAFTKLRERPRFLIPMLAISIAMALQMYSHYNVVDVDVVVDHRHCGDGAADICADIRLLSVR